MKLAVYSFTDAGRTIAEKLRALSDCTICFSGPKHLAEDFTSMDGLVFISASGIAVRLIAPLIQSKHTDPAVIVLDDAGRFTISLLSGHLGGANALAEKIADLLGNTAVITTASDNRGMEGLDLFAQRAGLFVDDYDQLKRVMTYLVNGKRVALYSEIADEPFGIRFIKMSDFESEDIDYWLIISVKKIKTKKPACFLIPKRLYVGVGCKKNTPVLAVRSAIEAACHQTGVDCRGIAQIATIELKKNEAAIIDAANFFHCALHIYSNEKVNGIELADEDKSDFVFKTAGVYAVSLPCAKLSGGKLLVKKFIRDGVTVSIAQV